VKLRVDRDDDFLITGRRHCFWFDYDVGYDDDGRMLGAEVRWCRARAFSRPFRPRDDAGAVPLRQCLLAARGVHAQGYCAKTHTQSNTAFRGFGGPQGAIAIENILDSIARRLGLDPLDSCASATSTEATPAPTRDNVQHALRRKTLTTTSSTRWWISSSASSGYHQRRAEIAALQRPVRCSSAGWHSRR
jgi:xanthine dehydrogenase large subunit